MNTLNKVGIHRLRAYAPGYHFDLKDLARLRGLQETAFTRGIGQERMSIIPPDEDIITMAANAAATIVDEYQDISMVIFATESGFDLSKASGIYVHQLLGLPSNCRVFEVKQACYGGTAALQMACNHIQCNPQDKVLVLAADIAKYAPNTPAEASQGAGAIAMLITTNPDILSVTPESGYWVEDHMDFWRPPYLDHALVDGRLSCDLYLQLLEKSWLAYQEKTGLSYQDHQQFCYHTPVPKLAQKACKWLARKNGITLNQEDIAQRTHAPLYYNRLIGNTYTASLYIGLLSLLENDDNDLSGQRLGFYSYGSGCMAEFFAGEVVRGYQTHLAKKTHQNMLNQSKALSDEKYLSWISQKLSLDGPYKNLPILSEGRFRLARVGEHQRHYQANMATADKTIQTEEMAIHEY